MANRRDFYFRQLVTEAELDAGFAELERADRDLAIDLGLIGVGYGLGVSQAASPNLTVQVTGPGAAYDQAGQRMYIPSTQVVNVAVDESALSTAVVSPGNSRIVSVFLEFDRVLSDPRIDGLSATVYHNRAESYSINVAVGAEGVSPTAPALRTDQILLADITRTFGQTQILNSDISTTRRQWMFKTTSGTAVAVGTAEEAVQALATAIEANRAATQLNYAGGGAWLDGTTNPATTVELQLDKILTDLTALAGSSRIGAAEIFAGNIPAGTIASQIRHVMAKDRVSALMSLRKPSLVGVDGTFTGAGTNYVKGLAYGDDPTNGSRIVAVCGTNTPATKIMWSIGGEYWIDATGTFPAGVNDVVYSPGLSLFVAVGGSSGISTSVDGAAWTARTSAITGSLARVAWDSDNGRFVCIGNSTQIQSSTAGTSAWTLRTNPSGAALFGLHYSVDQGLWVIVGASATVLTSPDGVTWTDQSSRVPGAITGVTFNDVTFDDVNLVWVAFGEGGSVMTTPDPTTTDWTDRTSAAALGSGRAFDRCVYCSGGVVIASARADSAPVLGAGLVATWNGGVSWARMNTDAFAHVGASNGITALCYAHNRLYVGGADSLLAADGLVMLSNLDPGGL